MAAFVLSIAAIAGQTVPKEAFEYLNWDNYDAFAFYVTLFTIGTALYLLLLVGLMARTMRRSAPARCSVKSSSSSSASRRGGGARVPLACSSSLSGNART